MANLLGVTNSIPGHDSTTVNRNLPQTQQHPNIQNVPDTTRVVRPDGKSERQDTGDLTGERLRYDSNFQTFLQRLNDTPELLSALSGLFRGGSGIAATAGLSEGLAQELSMLMQMLQVDQSQMLAFFQQQAKSGSRFGGALFSLLRGAYAAAGSERMKADILQFVKRYSDFSSTGHIENNLLRGLRGMTQSMPASWAERLIELTGQLENGVAANDRAGNLKLLQGSIFPYMSEYVERTHDMGTARSLLTMLALDTARYESGSEQGLLQAFHQLQGYSALRDKLGLIDDSMLLRLLTENEFTRAAANNHFADRLAETAAKALRGEGGIELQNTFRDLVSAMLVNESVYLPLNHLVLPFQMEGKTLFSELWLDTEQEGQQSDPEESGGGLRLLLKLDVQGLGAFDMVLNSRAGQVELSLFCPDAIMPFSRQVQKAVSRILSDNGFEVGGVLVNRMERPLTVLEVFPKLAEGKNGVNVKI